MRCLVPVLLVSSLFASCTTGSEPARLAVVPPPVHLENPYLIAGEFELPSQEPLDVDGLHNLVFLGTQIISGAEPVGATAFARLRRMGVKTIVSVDGKVPAIELAASYNLRYVHVPIEYKGLSEEERMHLSKTFRELDGPFFVHCFHGKHRGPAAAALGRLVLDGIPREQAIAEMRQYCSTSPKYAGLYASIASDEVPSAEQTALSDFDFASAHEFNGLRASMIVAARVRDRLELAMDSGWEEDADNPDVNVLQDAHRLQELLVACEAISGGRPADYNAWMQKSLVASQGLVDALQSKDQPSGSLPESWEALAEAHYLTIEKACGACHKAYRNR
ncbi:MAG: hypothetical protein ACI8QC_000896 [Planctomycetota bacterium]|jgi:hypothetical protein